MWLTSFPRRHQTSWSAPNTYRGSSQGSPGACPRRGERRRLRGLETHRFPLAGRLKAMGSGERPVPVSTQLGRGAAHTASGANVVPSRVSSEHGSPINARDSGTSGPDARRRSRPHDEAEHRVRSGSVPSRVQLGDRLSRAPRAPSGVQARRHRWSSPAAWRWTIAPPPSGMDERAASRSFS